MAIIRRRRIFGEKVQFRSLSCAPVNELGVVYLFGVLHDALGLKIESIQAGFPDCIARRRIRCNRWEEVRIEFEYESRSFLTHGHDPSGVDIIVCWRHNWPNCPCKIEIVELAAILQDAENVTSDIQTEPKLSAWQEFCQKKRLEGVESFSEIARLWREQKNTTR